MSAACLQYCSAAHLSHFIPRQVDRQLQISDLVVILASVLVAPGGRPHRPLLPDIVVVVAVVVVGVDSGLQQPLVQACVRVICNYIISNLHNVQFTNNPLRVSGAVSLDSWTQWSHTQHHDTLQQIPDSFKPRWLISTDTLSVQTLNCHNVTMSTQPSVTVHQKNS